MEAISFNNKKLRLAQDLNKRVLEKVGLRILEKGEGGIYEMPDISIIAAYLNSLAEKRLIPHYRLTGDKVDVFLFDGDDLIVDLEIMEVSAKKITEVIKIQCYDEKVDANDSIPIEISKIENLFKLPSTLFNSGTCIYFLCRDEKVVYVGQSENVHRRLLEHIETKLFDSVFYIRVQANKMNKIESALISYLKPEYNNSKSIITNKSKSIAESALNTHGFTFQPLK